MPAKSYSKIYEYDGFIIRGLANKVDLPLDDNTLVHIPTGLGYQQFLGEHLDTYQSYLIFIDILGTEGNIEYTKCLQVAQYSDVVYNGILNFIAHYVEPEIINCIKEYKFED